MIGNLCWTKSIKDLPLKKVHLFPVAATSLLLIMFSLLCLFTICHFIISTQWVIDRIDQMMWAFFWTGKREVSAGQCVINWDTLCTPKQHGDLGIIKFRDFNISLFAKWWLKLLQDHPLPWARLVKHNYYQHRRLQDLIGSLPGHISPFWHEVLRYFEQFHMGLCVRCDNGEHTKFWQDRWICDQKLAAAFPTLSEIAQDGETTIASQFFLLKHGWTLLSGASYLVRVRGLLINLLLFFRCIIHPQSQIVQLDTRPFWMFYGVLPL